MTEIFKICKLTGKDRITNITVFMGSINYNDDLNEIIKIRPVNDVRLTQIFKEDQLSIINNDPSITVTFTKQSIYLDDTIETIKKKIIMEYSKQVAFDEIYLFTQQLQTIDSTKLYDNLTQNGKVSLTYDILFQFISNITNFSYDKIPEKAIYTYNDILNLNITTQPQVINIPLGQHIITSDDTYSYTVNPFELKHVNKLLETHADNIITTTNKDLLLSSGSIVGNTLYLTVAKDVLETVVSKNISEKFACHIYFPFLKEKGIFDLNNLNDKHLALVEANKLLINDKFEKQRDNIDLFYNIYNTKQSELRYIEKGVQTVEFVISQDYQFNLPLEIIFKLIRANKNIPFIKYNPSKKNENIYRLYCDKIAKNGKKIPYLPKNVIFKLMKTIGTSKKVACYIEQDENGVMIPIFLEFDNYANIYVKVTFKQSKTVSNIEQIIRDAVNPTIQIVQDYLKNSGYNMNLFSSLYDKNLEILNLKYFAYISIEKNINLNTILGCVSSLFNVVVGELKKGIVMRYKRVANFNEMDSQEAFIVELLNKANVDQDIVKALMDNFQLKETDAQLKIAELLNNVQVVQNLSKRRTLKIKNNPGFLTKITQDQFKQNIMIEMENINNIFYMSTIPIYLDSLVRITQAPNTSSIELSKIDELCKTKTIDDLVQIDEIVAPSEKHITENIPAAIIAQNLTFGEQANKSKEKTVNVLDFLFEDDDLDDDGMDENNNDDDIEIEYVGGNDSNSDTNDDGIDVTIPDDDDEGIDVNINEDENEDEGIDVNINEDENEDVGINVNLPVDEDAGIDVNLSDNDDNEVPVNIQLVDKPNEPDIKPVEPDIKPVEPAIKAIEPAVTALDVKPKKTNKKPKMIIDDDDTLEQGVTGMKIANPNPFFKSMYKKDPVLFLTESDGKYLSYSRACPWNKRRQPVILTDEEKEKIDVESPGSYEHAIKYGSSPDKQYWYICPRYWDLKNNISLTDEQVKSGKYGGIIPQDAETVPPGETIWEFTHPREHIDNNGKYIQHYPGFLKKDAHPDGLSVPCCFKTWDKPAQQKRRIKCAMDTDKIDLKDTVLNTDAKIDVDEYIKGPDKLPLEEGRFGYLPFAIQQFIQTDNKKCQISVTNRNLKKEYPCYLRKGVENTKNKSFLACIADVYSELNQDKILPVEKLITDKIIQTLTLDSFVRYQNGNLITSFRSKQTDDIDLNVAEYSNTKIYDTLIKSDSRQLKIIISAYINFKEFLMAPTSVIDHVYLWDLICENNTSLFVNGLNLIILELPQDDITTNINIICPSNFYSVHKFDMSKDTAIFIKKYEYYEPVYIVVDKSKTNTTKLVTTKLFTPELITKIPNLKTMAETILDIYNSMCKPLYSILDVAKRYNFKEIKFIRNHPLEKIIEIIKKYQLQIIDTVINYDSKVIGLHIQYEDMIGYIPCYPSGILTEYPIITMDNEHELKNFEDTILFLSTISRITNNEILCKPVVKVLEDGLIVGVLTQTNQFIELTEPEQNVDTSILYTIDEHNYYQANKDIQTSSNIDIARTEYVNKIRLETELYNSFRSKLKMLLNQFNNKSIRDEIEQLSNAHNMVYYIQLDKLIRLIRELMKNEVEFIISNNLTLPNIEASMNKSEILLIPKNNLLSNLDNEIIYYSKISDELIRYNRIKQFMFEPKTFLTFTDLKYNLNDDEIILLQSLLTSDYFEDMIPDIKNKYITYKTYDMVEPIITQHYDNEYSKKVPEREQPAARIDKVQPGNTFKVHGACPAIVKPIYSKLKSKFKSDYKELEFSADNSICSFDIALTIIKTMNPTVDINIIKNILIEEYNKLYSKYPTNIIHIFSYYGMNSESKLLSTGNLTIEQLIMNSNYYLTTLDLLILSNIFSFPITLIAPRTFKENTREYLSYNVTGGNTYIVRVPGFSKYKKDVPKYKMIIDKTINGLLDVKFMPESDIKQEILEQNNDISKIIQMFVDDITDDITEPEDIPEVKVIKKKLRIV